MAHSIKLDFAGQHFHVGLDVHKNRWSVSIYSEHFEHKTFSQPPRVDMLVKYLRRNFPGGTFHCVYEAGFCGYWIAEQLEQHGIDCVVVHPADIPTKSKERTNKSDRVDCRKLARSLRNGDLKGIFVPSRDHLEDRHLLRTRRSTVKKQTRCKNQIKALLHFYGIEIPPDFANSYWSARFIRWIESIPMRRPSGQAALAMHLQELHHLRQIISVLNKEIRQLSRSEHYGHRVRLLRSIHGISTLSAMTLLTELVDIKRFPSLDKLASFVGLVPSIHASGEREYVRGMTCRRSAILRSILIESAWVAVRKDPALMMAHQRLSQRSTKTKAIVPIARKLLNRIRYVLNNNEEYVSAHV